MKRCTQCGKEYADNVRFCTTDGQGLEPAGGQFSLPTVKAVEAKMPESDPMIGRVIAGRYRLMEKLGQGGMGTVYKGQHIKMQRLTAIKILTSDLVSNEEFIVRFQREAEMASQIDHPNAVSIYDFGEAEDGLIYLAMEFVDGPPLSEIMRREGPLPLDRVVRITKQAAEALGAAHALGIIHRDFKPDNIMVCDKPGRRDWVEVVDFGIAKRPAADAQQQGLTQVGFVLGTPLYMSPEQVAGELLDQRSDLYSLALVAYEMLSGDLPFEGATTQSKMVKRLLEPPRLISHIRPQLNVPPAVEAVILRALARTPNQRYSSTVEFAAAFEAAARPEPVAQPRYGVTHPQQDVTQRSPNTPVDTRPRPGVNPIMPSHPAMAPPNPGPNTPAYNTPYPVQPSPGQYNPVYPQHSQTPTPFHPTPPKSNVTRNAVLIIVAIVLSLLGGCVVIVGILSNAN
jgi:serine/threonine protein kinase